MAERFKDIRVNFTGNDTQIRQVTARVGKQFETMGGQAKKMSVGTMLGFRSITNAAERLGMGLGLQTAYMTDLSQAFEQQAQRGIPRWVFALGGGVLAIGGLALAVRSIINQKKKLRDELEKSVKALGGEIKALFKATGQTREQTRATFNLLQAKRELYLLQTPRLIRAQEEEVQKLEKRLEKAQKHGFVLMEAGAEFNKQAIAELKLQAEIARAELQGLQADLDRARGGITFEQFDAAAQKRREARQKELITEKAYGDSMIAEFRRRQQESERVDQMITASRIATAQNFATTFQLMSQIGTKHARKWFTAYKIAATAEALISSYAAFTKTLKEPLLPYPLNIAAASSVLALGLAKVAAIRAQTFDGGGGAGRGAVGTFPANPATGLPEGGAGRPTNINITIVDREGRRIDYGEISLGVAEYAYNNNNSVGPYQLNVERSA